VDTSLVTTGISPRGLAASIGELYWTETGSNDFNGSVAHARKPESPIVVNDLVTFTPVLSTFEFVSSTTGCPSDFAGKFSFTARLTNESGSPQLSDLVIQVRTLGNH